MKFRFAAFVTLAVLATFLGGGFLGVRASTGSDIGQNSPNDFLAEFTEAIDVIQKNHVDNVSADKLVYSAIKGMLRRLDPHSSFFDPKEFARLREEQHSKYYGLGIRVRTLTPRSDRGPVVIVEPPAIGSPAEKRGLRAGDVITKVGGESIENWTQEDTVNHLRGPRGTTVDITVERQGAGKPLQFRVERDEIPIITVPYAFQIKPGIGYVKVNNFAESTADELKEKLDGLDPGKLSGLILDLRDNPGGLLSQAIDIADLFVRKGLVIVSTNGRMPGSQRPYNAPSLEKIQLPLIVLINQRSASASEIVAGALQDHDRALIVGETSFGKGLVQSVYQMDNNTGMALTTARYYTPSGRLIQRDYQGSAFDYYNLPEAQAGADKPREIKKTDSGRQVLGGGGIAPDVKVTLRELNRFEARLNARDVFFEYARRLASGQVPAASNFRLPIKDNEVRAAILRDDPLTASKFEITDAILNDFKEFLRNHKIEFTDKDIEENIGFIKRRIKQEVFTSSFGLQEGFRVAVQGDSQVQKALELMPEAKTLMTTGRLTPVAQSSETKK
ncbi:MAG: carboxyl-terminal protease [Acidobacteria bacterium]|nr:carboxyl-terminal protease [Acidobacteriota bacterium]